MARQGLLSDTLGAPDKGPNAPNTLPPEENKPQLFQRQPAAPVPTLEQHWEDWKRTPTPENMDLLSAKSKPIVDKALTSYAGGNPALLTRARILAAQAFKSYDPKGGAKLQTHLMTQLQPLIRHQKEYTSVVHVPERVQTDLYRVNQEHQNFFDENGREASDSEMADRTGLSMRRIAHVRKFQRGEVAESTLTSTTEEGEQETFYPGTQTHDPQKIWTEYVHHDLSPVDQKILEWKTGYNGKDIISNNEIASRLKLSAGAVSQRSAKIAKLLAQGQEINL